MVLSIDFQQMICLLVLEGWTLTKKYFYKIAPCWEIT